MIIFIGLGLTYFTLYSFEPLFSILGYSARTYRLRDIRHQLSLHSVI